jgi:hypothetical protein
MSQKSVVFPLAPPHVFAEKISCEITFCSLANNLFLQILVKSEINPISGARGDTQLRNCWAERYYLFKMSGKSIYLISSH